MRDDIIIRFRWTADEMIAAYHVHFRHKVRPVFRWGLWLLGGVFIAIGALEVLVTRAALPGGFLIAVGLYVLLARSALRTWMLRRQFAKRPDRDSDVEWRISVERLRVQGAHSSSELAWSGVSSVLQTPAGFLFYANPQLFNWLPRHGFASDAEFERLAQLAKEHAGQFRVTVE